MLRIGALLVVVSFITVIFSPQFHMILHFLALALKNSAYYLSHVFANTRAGNMIAHTAILTLLPFVITAVPAGGYFLIKRHKLPKIQYWLLGPAFCTKAIFAQKEAKIREKAEFIC